MMNHPTTRRRCPDKLCRGQGHLKTRGTSGSISSLFLMNIGEKEVPVELSRDPVSPQSLKTEFMYQVIPQWKRTLERRDHRLGCTPTEENMVNLQSLKAKFMYKVISQRERTLEEKIDLGMHRYIFEETIWDNDGKTDPGHNSEVARILNKHPDKWVYWYIYEQTLWKECRP
ncbi:hypothetical protein LIER_21162 [Lithospermum erythrorhizon]|uniref:Uncharacterized protein n=1 Tax=Lithospermum erythrorhizon TaxID=34254 RepID=A0AAV3QSD3_LITER